MKTKKKKTNIYTNMPYYNVNYCKLEGKKKNTNIRLGITT